MSTTRFNTEFEVRYADRLMRLHARFHGRVDTGLSLVSFLSGTAAFAGLIGADPTLAAPAGIVLAAVQAVQFVMRPAEKRAAALSEARGYRHLMARQGALSDEAFANAMLELRAEDEVEEIESLRPVAYNGVLTEMGCSQDQRMPVPFMGHLLQLIA